MAKPKPDSAALAMQSMLTKGSTNVPLDETILLFVDALKEIDQDRVFTVVDMKDWAAEYQRLENKELPQEFFNSYALGKYLKAGHERLGLEPQGTYGNRQVWGLKNG